jgi:glutamate-1-semialdehyde aminotransferase
VGTRDPIVEYQDFDWLDLQLARAFFLKCIEKGVYFHTDFTVSALHDSEVLDKALGLIIQAAREVKKKNIN